MSWLLVLAGVGLIAAGVDAALLARHSSQLPWPVIAKMVYGDRPPELTGPARATIEHRFIIKNGTATLTLSVLFAIAGAVIVAVGLGAWS
jgi:hypothetical protein